MAGQRPLTNGGSVGGRREGTTSPGWGLIGRVSGRRPAKRKEASIMKKSIRAKAAAVAGLLAVSVLASACNTVEGAGKDTSNLGKDISHSAEQNK
jgi:predicted small secreted protein